MVAALTRAIPTWAGLFQVSPELRISLTEVPCLEGSSVEEIHLIEDSYWRSSVIILLTVAL
jgi:hypothetical protein